MNCLKCETENLESAKFCKKCGHGLGASSVGPVKRKPAVKISKGKIKKIIIAGVIIGLIGVGAMYVKGKSDQKRVLSVKYLEDMGKSSDEDCNIMTDTTYGKRTEKEIDAELNKCSKFMNEFGKVGEALVVYAREGKFNDNKAIDDFVKIYDAYEGAGETKTSSSECSRNLELASSISSMYKLYGFNEKQIEKLMAMYEEVCSISKKLEAIDIKREKEIVKADYVEQKNDKIPAGYSIVTTQPQDGEKEKITLLVDGVQKGAGEIISKEPQKGIKMIGSGNTEEIAKQAEVKLNQIVKLWQDQNFTAATILPFLTEENASKAPELESYYKKVIFNWRRFDKIEPMLGQANFEEYKLIGNNDNTHPFVIYLPVTVSYYSTVSLYSGANTLKIPFYYSTEKNEWVSDSDTIDALFGIVKAQTINAEASPNSFAYEKIGGCKTDAEVTIENVSVSGIDAFNYNYGRLSSNFSLGADGFAGDSAVGGSTTVPLSLVDFVNAKKITVLSGKSFTNVWYPECRVDKNVSFTFFK